MSAPANTKPAPTPVPAPAPPADASKSTDSKTADVKQSAPTTTATAATTGSAASAASTNGPAPPPPPAANDATSCYNTALAFNRLQYQQLLKSNPDAAQAVRDAEYSFDVDHSTASAEKPAALHLPCPPQCMILVCALQPLPPSYTTLTVASNELIASIDDRIRDWLIATRSTPDKPFKCSQVFTVLQGKAVDKLVTFGYYYTKALTTQAERLVPSVVAIRFVP